MDTEVKTTKKLCIQGFKILQDKNFDLPNQGKSFKCGGLEGLGLGFTEYSDLKRNLNTAVGKGQDWQISHDVISREINEKQV